MIFNKEPENFNSKMEVVSCFCENNGKILLLHRQNHKHEGDKWGTPAGKMNGNETTHEAMLRELKEETGFELKKEKLQYFGKVFVKYPNVDFIYHIFSTNIDTKFVSLDFSEHKDFTWVKPKEALKLDLVLDEDACIKLFYKI